jgi:hypothetical protein
MKVLVACEESQAVCKAFRAKGHEAYSCDILECSGGHPEWHIQGDVLPLLNGERFFTASDGVPHYVLKWDLIIAHPPCTRLCTTSQRWLYFGDKEYRSKKISEQQKAIVFFMQIALADCAKIAIENPQGIMSSAFRKPDCTYNPYDFEGETECKKTCLWLKGLNPLKPTRKKPLPKEERTQGIFRSHFDGKVIGWNDPECARMRSKTPLGVAAAMAEQWGIHPTEKGGVE